MEAGSAEGLEKVTPGGVAMEEVSLAEAEREAEGKEAVEAEMAVNREEAARHRTQYHRPLGNYRLKRHTARLCRRLSGSRTRM